MSQLSEKAQVAQIIKDNITTNEFGHKNFNFPEAMRQLEQKNLNTPANEKLFAKIELGDRAGHPVTNLYEDTLANLTIKKHEVVENYQECIGGGKVSGLSPEKERELFNKIIEKNTTTFGPVVGGTRLKDVNFGKALEDLRRLGIDTPANIEKLIKREREDDGNRRITVFNPQDSDYVQEAHAAWVGEGEDVCRTTRNTLHPGKK